MRVLREGITFLNRWLAAALTMTAMVAQAVPQEPAPAGGRAAATALGAVSSPDNCAMGFLPKAAWSGNSEASVQALHVWNNQLFAGVWGSEVTESPDPLTGDAVVSTVRRAEVWRFTCQESRAATGSTYQWKYDVVFTSSHYKITSLASIGDVLYIGAGDEENFTARVYSLQLRAAAGGKAWPVKWEYVGAGAYPWAMVNLDNRLVVGTASPMSVPNLDTDCEASAPPITGGAFVARRGKAGEWSLLGSGGPWTERPLGRPCGYTHVDALLLDPRPTGKLFAAVAAAVPRGTDSSSGGASVWHYDGRDSWHRIGAESFLAAGQGSPQWAEDLAIVGNTLFVAFAPDGNRSPRWPVLRSCGLSRDCKNRAGKEDWPATQTSDWAPGPSQLGRILEFGGTLYAIPGWGEKTAGSYGDRRVTRLYRHAGDRWSLVGEWPGCQWSYAAVPWGKSLFVGLSKCERTMGPTIVKVTP